MKVSNTENGTEPVGAPSTRSKQVGRSKLDKRIDANPLELGPVSDDSKVRGDIQGEGSSVTIREKSDTRRKRKDSGHIHTRRHGILARNTMRALVELGENLRSMRRMEREFRTTLQPGGALGNLLFDRFWSCYLRLILVGRLEANLLTATRGANSGPTSLPSIASGDKPTLILGGSTGSPSEEDGGFIFPTNLFQQLALVQRYDRHQSREMYRALAMLLLMRRGGESALEGWAVEVLGRGKLPSAVKGGDDD